LSGDGEDEAALRKEIENFAARITERVGKHVVAQQDITLEEVVLNLMREKGLKLAVAESCTGGYISHVLTQHAGSSDVFLGGAVTYANELKEGLLGVKHTTIEQYGAVSEQTVTEMVEGALANFNADYSIAVTGIAGPGGGTPDKPVGTVWVGVAKRGKTMVKKFTFGSKRTQNIERSAVGALFMLITLLREN
jgi:nicotinamide-nucleotide amidase